MSDNSAELLIDRDGDAAVTVDDILVTVVGISVIESTPIGSGSPYNEVTAVVGVKIDSVGRCFVTTSQDVTLCFYTGVPLEADDAAWLDWSTGEIDVDADGSPDYFFTPFPGMTNDGKNMAFLMEDGAQDYIRVGGVQAGLDSASNGEPRLVLTLDTDVEASDVLQVIAPRYLAELATKLEPNVDIANTSIYVDGSIGLGSWPGLSLNNDFGVGSGGFSTSLASDWPLFDNMDFTLTRTTSPAISLKKYVSVDGAAGTFYDAQTVTGPEGTPGSNDVYFRLIISNTGDEDLVLDSLTDVITLGPNTAIPAADLNTCLAAAPIPLTVGASFTCPGDFGPYTAAAPGSQHGNEATVVGHGATTGTSVTDSDQAHYYTPTTTPDISLKKYVSVSGGTGTFYDAQTVTGPEATPGSSDVYFRLVISNTGDEDLVLDALTDVIILGPNSPIPTADLDVCLALAPNPLVVGATFTCPGDFGPYTAAAAGAQHGNDATVVGHGATSGTSVTDSDPAHYYTTAASPAIDLEKSTNGHDADDPTGPQLEIGSTVTWEYFVTNIGNVPLSNVIVTDDQGVTVECPQTTLEVGETMVCTASGIAIEGQYENLGTVTGEDDYGTTVTDTDPSHYFGVTEGGGEGCTPGYWKQKQHFFAWTNPPYDPYSTAFNSVFAYVYEFDGMSLLDVLKQGGGGLKALGRHTVAALLNAASNGVSYDIAATGEVIDLFNAAYASGGDYEALKDRFESYNEQSCPLDNGK